MNPDDRLEPGKEYTFWIDGLHRCDTATFGNYVNGSQWVRTNSIPAVSEIPGGHRTKVRVICNLEVEVRVLLVYLITSANAEGARVFNAGINVAQPILPNFPSLPNLNPLPDIKESLMWIAIIALAGVFVFASVKYD